MAVSNTPALSTQTGKRELTPTEEVTLVLSRDVMATVLDALRQATKAGMKYAAKSYDHNGQKVVMFALAITGFDVVAQDGTFYIDGRCITTASDWDDLRDVMAEEK